MRIALVLSLIIAMGVAFSILRSDASVPALQPRTYELIGRHAWPPGLDHGARLVSSEIGRGGTVGGRTVWRMTFQEPSGTVKVVTISMAAFDLAGEYTVLELRR